MTFPRLVGAAMFAGIVYVVALTNAPLALGLIAFLVALATGSRVARPNPMRRHPQRPGIGEASFDKELASAELARFRGLEQADD